MLQTIETKKPQGFTSLSVVSNLVAVTGTKGSRMFGSENNPTNENNWARTPRNQWSFTGWPLAVHLSSVHAVPIRLPPARIGAVAKLGNRAYVRDFTFSPRGGAFDFSAADCRSARRFFFHPALPDWNLGFRVALVIGPQ